MSSGAEAQVPVRLATDIEFLRALERLRIAIGASVEQPNRIALPQLDICESEILEHVAMEELQRRVEAQDFFDGTRDYCRSSAGSARSRATCSG